MQHVIVLEMVENFRKDLPRAGTPKVYHSIKNQLEAHKIKMGRAALNSLLADHGLLIRRKRRRAITTNSFHRFRKYSNLIKDMTIDRSEQVWVCDITYIRVAEGFSYLSLVTDAYSKRIMGHCLYPTLQSDGPLIALVGALENRCMTGLLIHHSDRGIQYCCDEYTELLKAHKIPISMTTKGDPYENAIAERVNGILKDEFDCDKGFPSHREAQTYIASAIVTYNDKRPHLSCDYLTPNQAHQSTGLLIKRWQSRKKEINAPS